MLRAIRFFSTQVASVTAEAGPITVDKTIIDANHPRPPRDTRSTKEIFDELEERLAFDPAFREQYNSEQASLDRLWEEVKNDAKEEAALHARCPHKHGY